MEERQSVRPLIRQTYIMLTIVVISFCVGLIEGGGQEKLLMIITHAKEADLFKKLFEWRNLCQNTVPFLGVTFLTIIAEFGGRKPAFAVIILLTMTASSLSILETKLCLMLFYIASAMSTGGQMVLFYISIAEYCEPKHRLVFSIANITANRIGYLLERIVYLCLSEIIQMYYVQCFEIFLAAVCLASLLTWPESPYWLALKGRQDASMKSFVLLRCDRTASENEFKAALEPRDRPDSFKLFFLPLFITILLFSTFWCSILFQNERASFGEVLNDSVLYQTVMECFTILVVCKSVHFYYKYGNIVILLVLITSVILQYASTIPFYLHILGDPTEFDTPKLVIFAVCHISVIIGPTTLSISKFAEYIPLKRRSLLMCISGICFFLIKIAYRHLTIIVEEKFGNFVLLSILTTMMFLGIVLVCFMAPRTEGKTLTEIEALYLSKRRLNDNS